MLTRPYNLYNRLNVIPLIADDSGTTCVWLEVVRKGAAPMMYACLWLEFALVNSQSRCVIQISFRSGGYIL